MEFAVSDWDNAYANSDNIAGGDRWPGAWPEPARRFRDRLMSEGRAQLDLAYGPGARNMLDLFLPVGKPKGVVVFIHGGYWMALDKSWLSHLANGPLEHGYAVAMPSYTLCPEARISDIAGEIGAAVGWVAGRIDGPVMLTGHSAGGQLAARMVCDPSPLSAGVQARIRNVVAISGLHDLRPLLHTAMAGTLRLDKQEAAAESPALLYPLDGTRITCWVGGAERAEFRRQSDLLANIWRGLGAATDTIVEPDRHHYDVVDGLTDPAHPLTQRLLG